MIPAAGAFTAGARSRLLPASVPLRYFGAAVLFHALAWVLLLLYPAELARFAAYAFCKAHAAGYGALGWRSAYYRTHHPTEWAVGILNHHAGMYATWVHVEDLRRAGALRTADTIRGALEAEFDKFTVWP